MILPKLLKSIHKALIFSFNGYSFTRVSALTMESSSISEGFTGYEYFDGWLKLIQSMICFSFKFQVVSLQFQAWQFSADSLQLCTEENETEELREAQRRSRQVKSWVIYVQKHDSSMNANSSSSGFMQLIISRLIFCRITSSLSRISFLTSQKMSQLTNAILYLYISLKQLVVRLQLPDVFPLGHHMQLRADHCACLALNCHSITFKHEFAYFQLASLAFYFYLADSPQALAFSYPLVSFAFPLEFRRKARKDRGLKDSRSKDAIVELTWLNVGLTGFDYFIFFGFLLFHSRLERGFPF